MYSLCRWKLHCVASMLPLDHVQVKGNQTENSLACIASGRRRNDRAGILNINRGGTDQGLRLQAEFYVLGSRNRTGSDIQSYTLIHSDTQCVEEWAPALKQMKSQPAQDWGCQQKVDVGEEISVPMACSTCSGDVTMNWISAIVLLHALFVCSLQ